MYGVAPSVDSKPCRCLFYITPVFCNSHFTSSSLLFSITNIKFAPISGRFQAPLPRSKRGQEMPSALSSSGNNPAIGLRLSRGTQKGDSPLAHLPQPRKRLLGKVGRVRLKVSGNRRSVQLPPVRLHRRRALPARAALPAAVPKWQW